MYVCVYILCVTGLLFVKGDNGKIGASIFSLLCGYVFVGKESRCLQGSCSVQGWMVHGKKVCRLAGRWGLEKIFLLRSRSKEQ